MSRLFKESVNNSASLSTPKKKKRMSARHNIRSTSIRLFTEESMMDVLPSLVFSFFRPCETIQLVGCLLCFWWIVPFKSCFDQQDERLHISPDKGLLSRPESWIFMETAIIGGGPKNLLIRPEENTPSARGGGCAEENQRILFFFRYFPRTSSYSAGAAVVAVILTAGWQ